MTAVLNKKVFNLLIEQSTEAITISRIYHSYYPRFVFVCWFISWLVGSLVR